MSAAPQPPAGARSLTNSLATFALSLPLLVLAATALAAERASIPQFGPAISYSAGFHPSSIAVADFNGDGKADVAATAYGVNILWGIGSGTLTSPMNIPPNHGSYLAAIGDFNNDGNPDLVTLSDYCCETVRLGDGKGQFVVSNFSLPWSSVVPMSVAVDDFNGDGKPDLAVLGSGENLAIMLGRGDGSFTLLTNYNYSSVPSASDLRSCDLNGDGKPDLALSCINYYNDRTSNALCILTNNGNGTFGTPRSFDDTKDVHRSLSLADFDHDGKPDVALLNESPASITIWRNAGGGSFTRVQTYRLSFQPTGIAGGDFNGDGRVDLIVRGDSNARVLVNEADGSFTVGPLLSLPTGGGSTRVELAIGDLNGDGTPDVAFGGYTNGLVTIMLNQTPPFLQIARYQGYNQISWLNTFGKDFSLEQTTNLSAPDTWQPFPYPPVLIGAEKAVTDWASGGSKFYRLRKP